MAVASSLEPTDDTTRYLRWLLLLVDGGTMVLRHVFDSIIPPAHLHNHLMQRVIKSKLVILHRNHTINDSQNALLYPHSGPPDSSMYDITLLTCLLHNICGLNHKSLVWTGTVNLTDVSTEADIVRLRKLRNKVIHTPLAAMTETTFMKKWSELEQVLLILGNTLNGLQDEIDALKSKSIDTMQERQLQQTVKAWEHLDKSLQEKLESIKHDVSTSCDAIKDLTGKTNSVADEVKEIYTRVTHTANLQHDIEATTETLKHDISDVKISQGKVLRDIQEVKEDQTKMKDIPSELRPRASMSKISIGDALKNDVYVETGAHKRAKEILLKEHLLVINGFPGEGKTLKALTLVSEISTAERFLKLVKPSDLEHVDLSLGMFDIILIDDIFGAGIMESELVHQWEKHLPDIYTAAKNKNIKVIITTRHYILEDAKEILRKKALFKEETIIHLSSSNLSKSERSDILRAHLEHRERTFEDKMIDRCVSMFGSFLKVYELLQKKDFAFGFPQCAALFTSKDDLFQRGPEFFSQPNEFLRDCIEELYKDEHKFLALIMLWAWPNKPLRIQDLDLSSTSHELKRIAKRFGLKLKPKHIKILRKSLKHHQDGFVSFNSKNGSYSFSHKVIGDMFGLVVCRDYPEEILKMECTRDFILKYVTADLTKRDDYHFYLTDYLYENLSKWMLEMILNPKSYFDENILQFLSGGNCPNTVVPTFEVDSSLVLHEVFMNEEFVKAFVDELQAGKNKEACEAFLTTPVMKMSGHFLGHGIKLNETKISLPEFALLNKRNVHMKVLVNRNLIPNQGDVLDISLMIATHLQQNEFVTFLIDKGAKVTEEAMYITALKEDVDILDILMKRREIHKLKMCHIINGSSALLASAKKGLLASVKCLVKTMQT